MFSAFAKALEKQLLLKQQLTSAEHRCEAHRGGWELGVYRAE